MTISPTPDGHPAWCDRQHTPQWTTHSAQIGADLEVSTGVSYAILLWQTGDEPAEVQLMRHTPDETEVTGFSILEASILRDLLAEGLGLLAREAGLHG